MTEETSDYTQEQIQGILLFLENDLVWYSEYPRNPNSHRQIIFRYLKDRIKDFQEELNASN